VVLSRQCYHRYKLTRAARLVLRIPRGDIIVDL
jgi:hypothetical protein